jgi:DNA mismatch endonuclease (patch repair protein)
VHGNEPRANSDYWGPKLARNVARDRAVDEDLRRAGWDVVRAWEHEPSSGIADRVVIQLAQPGQAVDGRRPTIVWSGPAFADRLI